MKFKKIIKRLGMFTCVMFLLSTSCKYGISFEYKLKGNSEFAIYGIKNKKRKYVGICKTNTIESVGNFGRFEFKGGKKESDMFFLEYDSIQFIRIPDSTLWTFSVHNPEIIIE
jgi:hypothetical protein